MIYIKMHYHWDYFKGVFDLQSSSGNLLKCVWQLFFRKQPLQESKVFLVEYSGEFTNKSHFVEPKWVLNYVTCWLCGTYWEPCKFVSLGRQNDLFVRPAHFRDVNPYYIALRSDFDLIQHNTIHHVVVVMRELTWKTV